MALIKCLIYQWGLPLWQSLFRVYFQLFPWFLSTIKSCRQTHKPNIFKYIFDIPNSSRSRVKVTNVSFDMLSILIGTHRVFTSSPMPVELFVWLNIYCRSFSLWYFIAAWKAGRVHVCECVCVSANDVHFRNVAGLGFIHHSWLCDWLVWVYNRTQIDAILRRNWTKINK